MARPVVRYPIVIDSVATFSFVDAPTGIGYGSGLSFIGID